MKENRLSRHQGGSILSPTYTVLCERIQLLFLLIYLNFYHLTEELTKENVGLAQCYAAELHDALPPFKNQFAQQVL